MYYKGCLGLTLRRETQYDILVADFGSASAERLVRLEYADSEESHDPSYVARRARI